MRLLLDEMFPRAAATWLSEGHDHDAVHVCEVGLSGADDTTVTAFARRDHRALVTENIADVTREPELVLVCALTRTLPSGGAQARALADLLDRWASDHPDPYLGQHWPA